MDLPGPFPRNLLEGHRIALRKRLRNPPHPSDLLSKPALVQVDLGLAHPSRHQGLLLEVVRAPNN